MFFSSVFNFGKRGGGIIYGFWRASLTVIIYPVILEEDQPIVALLPVVA